MSFSERVRGDERFVQRGGTGTEPLRLAIKQQLLYCATQGDLPAVEAFQAQLREKGVESYPITSLMTGLGTSQNGEDVFILHLDFVTYRGDVFALTEELRADSPEVQQHPRKVSPNHVLIPAVEDHSCPYGPPKPKKKKETLKAPAPSGQRKRVVIIDAGYQWRSNWGSNPLGQIPVKRGEYIYDAGPGTGTWKNSAPDVLDANKNEHVDALAGHGNFIAGVIQKCTPYAEITIRNHNGGFQYGGDDIPSEATVVRSLCRCRGAADVMNLGFAFSAFDDEISCAWDIAFAQLLDGVNIQPMIVAPAGNQNSEQPRYPAALSEKSNYMIGVGSTTGTFSNHGSWVTCSADGAGVESTFLRIKKKRLLEDGDGGSYAFPDAWAEWNGTSFATPKVVAAIVDRCATNPGLTPRQAWEMLVNAYEGDPDTAYGYKFDFCPG
jgi:hypothetical protein